MKKFIIVFIVYAGFICLSYAYVRPPVLKVEGTILLTQDYCGGANPGEAALADMRKPKPWANKKIYIRPAGVTAMKSKTVKEVVSDSLGNFMVYLLPGNYCIVEESKMKPFQLPAANENQTVDTACLRKEWSNCDYSFTVRNKNMKGIIITYHNHCAWTQPCINYHGPMPPSAAPGH